MQKDTVGADLVSLTATTDFSADAVDADISVSSAAGDTPLMAGTSIANLHNTVSHRHPANLLLIAAYQTSVPGWRRSQGCLYK